MIYYLFLFLNEIYPAFNNLFSLEYQSSVYRSLLLMTSIIILALTIKYLFNKRVSKLYFGVLIVMIFYLFGIAYSISSYNLVSSIAEVSYLTFLSRTIPMVMIVPIMMNKDKRWHLKYIGYIYYFIGLSLLKFLIQNIGTNFVWLTINFGGVNYNDFAYICVMNILFGFILLFNKQSYYNLYKFRTSLRFFVLIISYSALFLSAGRGAILASIVILVFFLNKVRLKHKLNYGKIIKTSLVLLIALPTLYLIFSNNELMVRGVNRAFSFLDFGSGNGLINWENTSGRQRIYYDSLYLIKNKPILGYGIGSVFLIHPSAHFSHNIILDVLVDGGIIHLLLWILIIILIFLKAYKCKENFYIDYSLSIFVLIMFKLLMGSNYLVESLFWYSIVMILTYNKYKVKEGY